MSNEDRALSPADGPAKVFGREPEYCGVFSRLSVGPLHMDIEHSSGAISPSSISGHYVQPERFFLDLFSALLSLIPAEQVVQAMEEETKLRIAEAMTPLLTKTIAHQLQEALARVEKAENAWRFANTALEGTQDKLARAQSEIEQLRTRAEDESEMVAIAKAMLAEPNPTTELVEVFRRACNGTGRKTEESDGKQGGSLDVLAGSVGHQVRPEEQGSQSSDVQPVGGDVPAVPADSPVPQKPEGIPASATIWAEVVDGLGRKVGAWFVADGLDGGPCVMMQNSDDANHAFTWAPSWDAEWTIGGTYRCSSAAAQCRQLYERGMKEQAEIKAWAKNMAGFVCDESIDTGAKAAAVLTAEATHQALGEDLEDYRPSAEELAAAADARGEEAPVTGPRAEESDESHSAQDSEGVIQAHRMLANGQCAEGDNRQREGDLQELSEATRPVCIRWVGWERTLTAVDLTELREAVEAFDRGASAWAVIEAARRLLPSGGAA